MFQTVMIKTKTNILCKKNFRYKTLKELKPRTLLTLEVFKSLFFILSTYNKSTCSERVCTDLENLGNLQLMLQVALMHVIPNLNRSLTLNLALNLFQNLPPNLNQPFNLTINLLLSINLNLTLHLILIFQDLKVFLGLSFFGIKNH